MTWILIVAIWGTQGMAITSVPEFITESDCTRAGDIWELKVARSSWACVSRAKPQPERGPDGWALDADLVFKSKVEALWAERRKDAFEAAAKRSKEAMSDAECKDLIDSLDRRIKKIETKKP